MRSTGTMHISYIYFKKGKPRIPSGSSGPVSAFVACFLLYIWLPFNDSTCARACDAHHHAYAHGNVFQSGAYVHDHRVSESFPYAHAHVHVCLCHGNTSVFTSFFSFYCNFLIAATYADYLSSRQAPIHIGPERDTLFSQLPACFPDYIFNQGAMQGFNLVVGECFFF